MLNMTPAKLEKISANILRASHKRPKSERALRYILKCNDSSTYEDPYEEAIIGECLLSKARSVVNCLPNTAIAIANGKAPLSFEEAYNITRFMK